MKKNRPAIRAAARTTPTTTPTAIPTVFVPEDLLLELLGSVEEGVWVTTTVLPGETSVTTEGLAMILVPGGGRPRAGVVSVGVGVGVVAGAADAVEVEEEEELSPPP